MAGFVRHYLFRVVFFENAATHSPIFAKTAYNAATTVLVENTCRWRRQSASLLRSWLANLLVATVVLLVAVVVLVVLVA